ncbi:MAG: hypothetical protein JNM65_11350 [Verrucomicrobiaceae bacterium]|nr:hypothetical protein [Verrucomicrobiaceae bacterium]
MDCSFALFAVLQFGGSSTEQYMHCYKSLKHAQHFIDSAEEAGYECIGPICVELPEVAELISSARSTLDSISVSNDLADLSMRILQLQSALDAVDKNLLKA